jgi:hypothetical protein
MQGGHSLLMWGAGESVSLIFHRDSSRRRTILLRELMILPAIFDAMCWGTICRVCRTKFARGETALNLVTVNNFPRYVQKVLPPHQAEFAMRKIPSSAAVRRGKRGHVTNQINAVPASANRILEGARGVVVGEKHYALVNVSHSGQLSE